ncbi:hypothetical protein Ct9H90mP29_10040 [bacterium]|nr:MAG: hypothetical protein Ct9H90mP29_10040 [bacterium]
MDGTLVTLYTYEGIFTFCALIGYVTFLFIKKDPPEEVHPESANFMSYVLFWWDWS